MRDVYRTDTLTPARVDLEADEPTTIALSLDLLAAEVKARSEPDPDTLAIVRGIGALAGNIRDGRHSIPAGDELDLCGSALLLAVASYATHIEGNSSPTFRQFAGQFENGAALAQFAMSAAAMQTSEHADVVLD